MRVFDADMTHTEPFDIRLLEYHEEPITSLSTSVNTFPASGMISEADLSLLGM
jgi:hypothetical protein